MTDKDAVREAFNWIEEWKNNILEARVLMPEKEEIQILFDRNLRVYETVQSCLQSHLQAPAVKDRLEKAYIELYEHAEACEILGFEGADILEDVYNRIAAAQEQGG